MRSEVIRSLTCHDCGLIIRGYGHGQNGENHAYTQALNLLRQHHCAPLQKPDPIPAFTGEEWFNITKALQRAMPDVTITTRKV